MPAAATAVRVELLGLAPLPSDLDPDEEGRGYGIALATCCDALTAAALRLGIRPLHRFSTNESDLWDELSEEVLARAEDEREAEAEILELLNERGEWHEAEAGLESVRALIGHFELRPAAETVCGTATVEDVLFDLRALELILAGAVDRERGFRLFVGG